MITIYFIHTTDFIVMKSVAKFKKEKLFFFSAKRDNEEADNKAGSLFYPSSHTDYVCLCNNS